MTPKLPEENSGHTRSEMLPEAWFMSVVAAKVHYRESEDE